MLWNFNHRGTEDTEETLLKGLTTETRKMVSLHLIVVFHPNLLVFSPFPREGGRGGWANLTDHA